MLTRFCFALVTLLSLVSNARAANDDFTTKELASICDQYIARGSTGADPALICATYFEGWVAAFTLAAGGKTSDGSPVYGGICEPETYTPNDVIQKFVAVVHLYPSQFDQPVFNDPMYAIPYTLKQAWPCKGG